MRLGWLAVTAVLVAAAAAKGEPRTTAFYRAPAIEVTASRGSPTVHYEAPAIAVVASRRSPTLRYDAPSVVVAAPRGARPSTLIALAPAAEPLRY
jgi:hypothetical protein